MDGEGGRFSASLLSLLPSWLFRSRACAEEKIEKKKLIGWRAILGTLMKIQVTFCFYTCTYSTLNQFLFMVIQSSISIFFRYVVVWFQLFCIRSHFFYYEKTWNRKKYLFADLQTFWGLIWKTFWHMEDIQINKYISNGKKFILKYLFCHFEFWHIRWNH